MASRLVPATEMRCEADEQVRDALRLMRRERSARAIPVFERALSRQPEHPVGHLHLALALAGEGRDDEAVAHAARACELAPDRPAFHLFAGRVLFDVADHAKADREFARALELSPGNDLAAGFKTLNDWALGDARAPARLDADRLPDSSPFLARLLFMIESELRGRRVEFEEPDARPPFLDRLRIAFMLWRGGALHKRGSFLEAMAVTDAALEICPGHPGVVRFQRDCRSAALEAVRRRLEERPDSIEDRLMLANLLLETDDFAGAEQALREAEAGDGSEREGLLDAPGVHRLRARIAFGLGRVEEALRETEAGCEPGFSMAETNYYLGLCRMALGERRLSFQAFERLVRQVCWAVPLRLREYQAWRAADPRPGRPSCAGT